MFALLNRKSKPESEIATLCRLLPGKLNIQPTYIKVYLADVDVMFTTYLKTKGMSTQDALETVKSSIATDRHHQIYI